MALTLALQPIDSVTVNYIDAAIALGNTINETDEYYTQENYKSGAFAKGETLYQTFLKIWKPLNLQQNLIMRRFRKLMTGVSLRN